jgi:hypothetical protein
MMLQNDKNLLPFFYAIKIGLMIYWLIGQDFVLNVIYRLIDKVLWNVLDNINYAIYEVQNIPLCARTGRCPFDHMDVLLAYKPLPDLTPPFVLMSTIIIFCILPVCIGWIFKEPVRRNKGRKVIDAVGDPMFAEEDSE